MRAIRYIFMGVLLAAVGFLPPASAEHDKGKNLLRGLLQAGIEAVGQGTDPAANPQGENDLANPAASPQNAGVNGFSKALKNVVEQTLDSVKDRYKEEGRAYARELSDVMVERLMHNPRVRSTLSTVQLVGVVLVGYLVLVTLALLVSILQLKRSNREILRLLKKNRELQASPPSHAVR